MIRIIIGGDISPMGRVQPAFAAGQASVIFQNLLPEIQSADLAVANLECPLVSRPSPISKLAPALGAPPECIRALKEAGWDVLNLANNHSYDHGAPGLHETMTTIRDAGLAVIGAGATLAEAQLPVVRQINGRRIVLYAMAEREFSLADDTTPGANPLDLIDFVQAVRRHKQGGTFIALLHGGMEYYPYPTPETVRRCRFMIDMGADAVICGHTHRPLPWEIYNGRPIVYGLGNLIFEPFGPTAATWHQGYLARLEVEGDSISFAPVPYNQSLAAAGASAMDEPAASGFRQELLRRGQELADRSLQQQKWREFCRGQRADYLPLLFAYSPTMDRFRRFLLPMLHPKREILQALMLAQCESHREVLESLLKDERSSD